jgi:3-deoxy-D-manno-octulosonic-acid transferase
MLASSREGEELALFQMLKSYWPLAQAGQARVAIDSVVNNVTWLIVPRHPQRFDEVALLAQSLGFTVSRRSAWDGELPADGAPQTIWLGDSLGEMALYYALADAALLGGSFEPLGGQNLIEAAACACPVVMGPHTYNFAEAAQQAELSGAAQRVNDLAEGMQVAAALALDPTSQSSMAQRATQFAQANRGAVAKTAQAVLDLLGQQRIDCA